MYERSLGFEQSVRIKSRQAPLAQSCCLIKTTAGNIIMRVSYIFGASSTRHTYNREAKQENISLERD